MTATPLRLHARSQAPCGAGMHHRRDRNEFRPADCGPVDPVLAVLHRVADAVAERIAAVTDWGWSGARAGSNVQYVADVQTDEVAVAMLLDAGFGVLSEESGLSGGERDRIVVIDPIDGSTN